MLTHDEKADGLRATYGALSTATPLAQKRSLEITEPLLITPGAKAEFNLHLRLINEELHERTRRKGMSQFTRDRIHEMFTYHKPTNESAALHQEVNERCEVLAHYLSDHLPHSAETTLAIRALLQARSLANAAVALYVTAGLDPKG